MPKYTYRDFIAGKHRWRWTRGKFVGWTESICTGLFPVKYAMFDRKSDTLFIPEYLLSKESKAMIKEVI